MYLLYIAINETGDKQVYYLDRKEAIEKVVIDAVDAVENIFCEIFGSTDNGLVMFTAVFDLPHESQFDHITIYYYQTEDDILDNEDLSDLDWEPHGYIVD